MSTFIWSRLLLGSVGLGVVVAVVRCTLENPPARFYPPLPLGGGRTTGTAAASLLQQRRRGADKLWMCPFAANCLQWKPFPIMQLEGMEGRGSAAVGKRTKLFVRPFSAPLFKFTLCSALPRSLQESDEKQPESREEENRESVQQRGLIINDVFKHLWTNCIFPVEIPASSYFITKISTASTLTNSNIKFDSKS